MNTLPVQIPSHAAQLLAIAARLEVAAPGKPVWRVAQPDGSFCLVRSYDDTFYPERECDEWIKEHAAYAAERQYSTQRDHVYSAAEDVMRAAAAELRQLAGAPGEPASAEDAEGIPVKNTPIDQQVTP